MRVLFIGAVLLPVPAWAWIFSQHRDDVWRYFKTDRRRGLYEHHHHIRHHVPKNLSSSVLSATIDNQVTESSSSLVARATEFTELWNNVWNSNQESEVLEFFIKDDEEHDPPFWRDMVAFTWNIHTSEGRNSIQTALQQTNSMRSGVSFCISEKPLPIQETENGGLEFWCDVKLERIGTGKAHFRINRENRIQTLLTTLMELEALPFQVGHNRIRGQVHGPSPGRKYWNERLDEHRHRDNPHVVIIGGGQAGLALGARLQFMGVPYTILEAGAKPGMAWRKRYPFLHLHDPCWYNHMPYLEFPETWPIFCPRDKIADWMEFYAKALDLCVETNTRVVTATQQGDRTWEVVATALNLADGATETRTIRTPNVVFATGNSSHPRLPKIPGAFRGLQLHSSQYQGGRNFKDLRAIVVGANNSGFDIAQDLWEQGAKKVTMIQRSPSLVVSTESILSHGLGPLYRQNAPMYHEDADLFATTMPYKLLLPRWTKVTAQMKETDKALHNGLADAGYRLDFGPDDMGVFAKSATEGGGFYIDMGCAQLVVQRQVGIRYADIVRLDDSGILLEDKETGQEDKLEADVIIYATGFDTMEKWVEEICGVDVANQVGGVWGLGLGKRRKDPGPWEGELRNMWKPTPVDGLWFHGGNLAQSRHYSRFLALQLGARYIGLETPVNRAPDHPTQNSQ